MADFTAPAGWQVTRDIDAQTNVISLEPPREGFRANLILNHSGLNGLTFRDWQVGTDQMLPTLLHDYRLIDLERLTVAGLPGGRRLVHHTSPAGEALVLEQWFTVIDDVGWTLSSTVDTLRYLELQGLVTSAARSLAQIEGDVR